MKINCSYFLFMIFFAMLIGCGKLGLYNPRNGEIVATVDGLHLYESDLLSIFSSSLSDSDSLALRNNFIDDWIKNQVLQSVAIDHISAQSSVVLSEIDKKVESYRKYLILYEFETSYIESNLDTVIDHSTLSEYYKNNISSFRLSSPLIKGAVARIPSGVRQSHKLENMFLSENEDDISEFLDICEKNNYINFNYVDSWVDISEIAKVIPFSINKADELLSKKHYYDVDDDYWHYMLRIDEYLPSGSVAPFDRVEGSIKKILLHDRRMKLKSALEDSLINLAVTKGLVNISK